ncbi:MAG: hypothetical protein CME36_19690 [unclassified Hahellaceae]|nr:hypothetical protein [Hahellaceae bacterium]|tara:strand:- start:1091 stop:1375 length:285 start_codon:yes stop_codon:yes gene_type:complete
MIKFLAGVAFGVVTTGSLFLLWLLPETRENYRAVGHNDGEIDAKYEIAAAIERELGRDVVQGEFSRPHQLLFEVKSSSVVVVERDGVKTVRVYH